MNILWIGAIIGLIIGIIVAINNCFSFWEGFGTAFIIGTLGTAICMVACVVGGMAIQADYEAGNMVTTKSTDEPISLITVCDSMGTDGKFYLGSGNIDS